MPGDPVPPGTSRSKPWVLVRAGASRLAIHSDWVRELLALPAVTRLPGLPPDALGLITWRGRAVPAIDLAARLGLGWAGSAGEAGEAAGRRMAVVVADGARHVALAVDAVDGVELLAADSVAPLPEGLGATGPAVREHGRTRRDGTLVLLLDVAGVLGGGRAPGEDAPGAEFWNEAAPPEPVDAPTSPAAEAVAGDVGRPAAPSPAEAAGTEPTPLPAPPEAAAAPPTPTRSRRPAVRDAATATPAGTGSPRPRGRTRA